MRKDNDYSFQTLKNTVEVFDNVASFLREHDFNILIAPMNGAVPFIDILNIVSDDLDSEKIKYLPASNKIQNVREFLRKKFKKIIKNNFIGDPLNIYSIDEIVSGNSAIRVKKQFDGALNEYVTENALDLFGRDIDFRDRAVQTYMQSLKDKIIYKIIGIEEIRPELKKNPEFLKLKNTNQVICFPINKIITMDNKKFNPVEYKRKKAGSKFIYTPEIKKIDYSDVYLNFLENIAKYNGKSVENIKLNPMKIFNYDTFL